MKNLTKCCLHRLVSRRLKYLIGSNPDNGFSLTNCIFEIQVQSKQQRKKWIRNQKTEKIHLIKVLQTDQIRFYRIFIILNREYAFCLLTQNKEQNTEANIIVYKQTDLIYMRGSRKPYQHLKINCFREICSFRTKNR